MHVSERTPRRRQWGLIDLAGKFVVEPLFDNISHPSPEGTCWAKADGGEFFIEPDGGRLFEGCFEELKSYKEGLAAAKHQGKWGYIDLNGTPRIPFLFERADTFQEGRACVAVARRQWGHVDSTGRLAVEPKYPTAEMFSEGRALVSLTGTDFGYVDPEGREIVPRIYSHASMFRNGLAFVVRKGGDFRGYIDRDGNPVLQNQRWLIGSGFCDGLAWCILTDDSGHAGFIDEAGEMVIAPRFDYTTNFSEQRAGVTIGKTHGVIDPSGEFVVPPNYENADACHEGLICLKKDGRYGYTDQDGNTKIPFQYTAASRFRNGLARVAVDV